MEKKTSYLLQPATFRLDGGAMYGIIPKPVWQKKSPPDSENRIALSLRLWAIKWKDRLALIDTGIGDYHGEKFDNRFDVNGPPNPLAQALRSVGFRPEDVTDLILTHLHFDHVGGLGIQQGENQILALPNARLYIHKKHFKYALNPTSRDSGSFHTHLFGPLISQCEQNNQVTWLEGNEGPIIDDINLNFVTSHGHTPYLIHPYDERMIYLADIVPTSHHISVAWVMGYDIAPGVSTEDKKRLFDFIIKRDLTVIFEHDPDFWGGKIRTDSGQYKAGELQPQENELAYSLFRDC